MYSGIYPEWVKNQHGHEFHLTKHNEKFDKFFSHQKICETEEEWQHCQGVMRTDLPQAFRLNTSR